MQVGSLIMSYGMIRAAVTQEGARARSGASCLRPKVTVYEQEEGSLATAWPGGTRPAPDGKHNGCR